MSSAEPREVSTFLVILPQVTAASVESVHSSFERTLNVAGKALHACGARCGGVQVRCEVPKEDRERDNAHCQGEECVLDGKASAVEGCSGDDGGTVVGEDGAVGHGEQCAVEGCTGGDGGTVDEEDHLLEGGAAIDILAAAAEGGCGAHEGRDEPNKEERADAGAMGEEAARGKVDGGGQGEPCAAGENAGGSDCMLLELTNNGSTSRHGTVSERGQ